MSELNTKTISELRGLLTRGEISAADIIRDVDAAIAARDGGIGAYLHRDTAAAIAAADPTGRIVVFGSFFTVGGVLQDGVPRLQAKHLNA